MSKPHRLAPTTRSPASCALGWSYIHVGALPSRAAHDAIYRALCPRPWWRRVLDWFRRLARRTR